MPTTDLVRAGALNSIAEVARRHGLDVRRVLRECGIPLACLDDPDRMIPVERAYRLLDRSAQLGGAPSFGLEVAEANRLSALGLLGLILRDEPTLRDALATLMRYRRVHNEGLTLTLDAGPLQVSGRHDAVLRFELAAPAGTPLTQAIEQTLGMMLRSLRALMPDTWRPAMACLVHGPVGPRVVYQRVVGIPVQFHADFNGVVFDAADLDQPLRAADPSFVRQARRQLDAMLEQRGAVSSAQRVCELVRVLLPAGRCSIEQVAMHLGMHRRTLHRHLRKEGSTFEAEVERVRRELARHLVADARRPLAQVSDLLGFAQPSAFSRWHRQAFGVAARQWRNRASE